MVSKGNKKNFPVDSRHFRNRGDETQIYFASDQVRCPPPLVFEALQMDNRHSFIELIPAKVRVFDRKFELEKCGTMNDLKSEPLFKCQFVST